MQQPFVVLQVYSLQQARQDIDSVFGMGLFEDVKFLPQAAEGSTLENPIVDLTLQVKERKASGLSAGFGMSAQVSCTSFHWADCVATFASLPSVQF